MREQSSVEPPFVMSAVCPVNSQQQTFPDAVGTSHLCKFRTFLLRVDALRDAFGPVRVDLRDRGNVYHATG
jgi:hypothetical protein